jgi:hypothetical protein
MTLNRRMPGTAATVTGLRSFKPPQRICKMKIMTTSLFGKPDAGLPQREVMSRIDDLRRQHGGQGPSTISTHILEEMLLTPHDDDEIERRARVAIVDGKKRGTLNYAIRARCLDCVGWVPSEVRACCAMRCPLWPFRMGDNPFRQSRTLSQNQMTALRTKSEADL